MRSTGYSSLDMKFIQSETAKPMDQGILRFIMGLSRWMDLSVVAEGVETREQLEHLREIGCDYVQRYYFAKPMPCADFEERLKELDAPEILQRQSRARQNTSSLILLVADEDEAYCKKVKETFGERYEVIEVSDENAAAAVLTNERHRLAVVILSLTLPKSGGFSVLKILEREKLIWKIPVVTTVPPDWQMEEKALEMGAASFWEKEQALRDEAYRDYLTGLLNRRGLNASVEALRREDMPLAIYLFDLDNLKQINDTFGHAEGDQIIRKFGEPLHSYSRGSDILARLGGDEFVVIMKQMGSEQAVQRKGEEICRAFREGCRTEDVKAACSVGIAICKQEEETLYANQMAKENGIDGGGTYLGNGNPADYVFTGWKRLILSRYFAILLFIISWDIPKRNNESIHRRFLIRRSIRMIWTFCRKKFWRRCKTARCFNTRFAFGTIINRNTDGFAWKGW